MARRDASNPFDETSNEPLQVPAGEFSSDGGDLGRTGATNARAVGNTTLLDRWRGSSQRRRVNLVSALALLLVMAVLLPLVISFVGSTRREAIVAQEAAGATPANVVVIQPEVHDAAKPSEPILGAVALSSGFVSRSTGDEMRALLDAVSTSLGANNVDRTKQLTDNAVSYFFDHFVPELLHRVPELEEEWWAMNWENVDEIDGAAEHLQGVQSRRDVDAVAKAVVELATALGNGRDEHMRNDVTYVPSEPDPAPAPAESAPPQETPKPDDGKGGMFTGEQNPGNNPPPADNGNSGQGSGGENPPPAPTPPQGSGFTSGG